MTDDLTAADASSAIDVRLLRTDEFRAAHDLFKGTMHAGPSSDDAWADRGATFEEDRVLGAFVDDILVGTTLSSGSQLTVPGGALLPMAMVTAVGVRADHTRRGVVTALMRTQLTELTEPVATLRASEAVIYGRFGYGVASRGRTVVLKTKEAAPRPSAPGGGRVRLIPAADATALLPELYDTVSRRRPGWSARPAGWWDAMRLWSAESRTHAMVAVHTGPDGDDGFATYTAERVQWGRKLTVQDLWADNSDAWAALWRFLASLDLVLELHAQLRPLDEPLEHLFVDRRAVRVTEVEDETWLRLADVPAALAARTFGELAPGVGSVVLEVRDAFLPANSGRYLIGDGPARPVDEPAELTLDVDVLAELYLGDLAPSALAGVGRIGAAKADALRVADRLFAVPCSPWCGTYF
jgi:predicted acetyltransferase